MRIDRLDLLRYGCFTDTSLPFPKSSFDFHIIFGPNEAGKSTSLAAIEDLLFGIPQISQYKFVHGYDAMRVGGVLEHGGKVIAIRRRKGNKNTLLDADDNPLPSGDGTLAAFLGGADRKFLTRMFSLNHKRLAEGGSEIIEARDDVGQMLFSAGSGLSGLRQCIASLAKDADNLWGKKPAGHRKYYVARDALEEADKAQREHTVTASKWQEIKRALDTAQEAYKELEEQIEEKSAEQRKLNRIRRVYRLVRRLAEVEEAIAEIGEVPSLPDDAEARLASATQARSDVQSKIAELDDQLRRAKSERAGLQCDEAILMLSDDIGQLHTQRIEAHREKADLPKRRAELAAKEQRLGELAEELGWESGDSATTIARIPQRSQVTAVRTLLTRRGELTAENKSAQSAFEEAQRQVRELQDDLSTMEDALDVSCLAAVTNATRDVSDVGARIDAAEREHAEVRSAIEKRLTTIRPQIANDHDLEAMPVPPRNVVQNCRDSLRDLEQEAESFRARIRNAENENAQHRRARERLTRDNDVVTPRELFEARQDRDAGWSLIRRRYVDCAEVLDEELAAFCGENPDLPSAYEHKVASADMLADHRFDKAEAAGQVAVIDRQIEDAEESLIALRREESQIGEKRRDLEAQWQRLWAGAPIEPLAPEFMLEWLNARTAILELTEKRNAAASSIAALQNEETAACALLIAELASLAEDTKALEEKSLRVVIEAALGVQQLHEKRALSKKATEAHIRKLQDDETRKQARREQARTDWAGWLSQWSAALKLLGFADDVAPEAITEHLDRLDQMRGVANDVRQLKRDRIDKIENDLKGFASSVAELVNVVAPNLDRQDPEEAVLQLETRLADEQRIRDQQKEKDKVIASLDKRIEECKEILESAQLAIKMLEDLARVEGSDQLSQAIRVSQRRRELGAENADFEETLAAEGDGHPLIELREECGNVDLDRIAARENTLQNELGELRNRLTSATEQRAQARQAFDAIGGDGRAAEAAAARQEALASMRDAAERYVRVRTAATLLEWAINRYGREKQAPLLKRAGQIFTTLTLGSFTDLRVEFDDQDRAVLAGIRRDRRSVRVGGMSDGTADQLYLALRLASVDEYLSRAHALPFIADDLLIKFDDARAAAGFEVLAELGQKTQILFFTHHQHLVDIARTTLGKDLNVVALAEDKVASAA